MKTRVLVSLLALLSLLSSIATAEPLGTAFTYQGRLNDGGNPANGGYDLTFTLFDINSSGSAIAGPLTNSAVAVSNGLFTVALDFGPGAFTGEARWLEIRVRTNGSASDFTVLSPRQAVAPTPYALHAMTSTSASKAAAVAVGAIGTSALQDGSVTAPKVAGGQLVKSLNGLKDQVVLAAGPNVSLATNGNTLTLSALGGSGGVSNAWVLTGNSNTIEGTHFLGTLNLVPLELRVNNTRVVKYWPDAQSPNILAGYSGNAMGSGLHGATISGGGVSGAINSIYAGAHYSAIGGGKQNVIWSMDANPSDCSTIAGGTGNLVGFGANQATIGGGTGNNLGDGSDYSTISGGALNTISNSAYSSSIGGGRENRIAQSAAYASVGGGLKNLAAQNYGTVSGGSNNLAGGAIATIGGGQNNRASASYDTVAGGYANVASGGSSTIAGGSENSASANSAFVGGGWNNVASGIGAVVAGGLQNTASGDYSTVPGGYLNEAVGDYSQAVGQRAKANHAGAFVWADTQAADFASTTNNQFLIRAAGNVGINKDNPATALDVSGTVTATAFAGSGESMTGVNADLLDGQHGAFYQNAGNLNAGTLPEARLSANVALLNSNQTFTGFNAFGNVGNSFTGNGSGLTGLNANHLGSGTLPDARLSGAYTSGLTFSHPGNNFFGNGSGLTSLNANNIASGTLPDGRLGGVYSSAVSFNNPGNSFAGNGSGLTSLNASSLAGGTVPDARLSANVALLGLVQTFTATKTFSVAPVFSTGAGAPFIVTSSTLVSGLNADTVDGSHATAFAPNSHTHGAADVTSGTLADARLSTNVAKLNASQTFTGDNTFQNGILTSDGSSGTGMRFKAAAVGAGTNTVVSLSCGDLVWNATVSQLSFTNKTGNYIHFAGHKNEGSGGTFLGGYVSPTSSSTLATLNANGEYTVVDISDRSYSYPATLGFVHVYAFYDNSRLVVQCFYRAQ